MIRPKFKDIKTFEEFKSFYWYREELKQICKSLNINSDGEKKDLLKIVEEYFQGNIIIKKKKDNYKNKIKDSELSLDTKVLECGFAFNDKFRSFFSDVTGIKNFKFNTKMVASVKKAKEDKDFSFTLNDLLDIYYGKKEYAIFDNSSCQWNKFLKDFCKDEASYQFKDKLKAAAILWKIVRNSNKEKIYLRNLLEENIRLLDVYKKD